MNYLNHTTPNGIPSGAIGFTQGRPRQKGLGGNVVDLSNEIRDWSHGLDKSFGSECGNPGQLLAELERLNSDGAWQWPERPIIFLSDLHADRKAFVRSLLAAGAVRKTGPGLLDFTLTEFGRTASFVIGGDCFDKGPSNLKLLRALKHLRDCGAELNILAGNHDIRTFVGMSSVSPQRDLRNMHFFLRMGPKAIPLLKEIHDKYLKGDDAFDGVPDAQTCRDILLPDEDWFTIFPQHAHQALRPEQVRKELKRIRKKGEKFEPACNEAGLCIRAVYAAARKWHDLFIAPNGEFHWYFRDMRLVHQEGSFIFAHAGFDDESAAMLSGGGVDGLNDCFRTALQGQAFDLYYGPLSNVIRTKYRTIDNALNDDGVAHLRAVGISAIVHGHRNLLNGQRLMLRRGIVNFECDATIDKHSRKKEGLRGPGAAATVIWPGGYILGVSTDYPFAKLFEPATTTASLRNLLRNPR